MAGPTVASVTGYGPSVSGLTWAPFALQDFSAYKAVIFIATTGTNGGTPYIVGPGSSANWQVSSTGTDGFSCGTATYYQLSPTNSETLVVARASGLAIWNGWLILVNHSGAVLLQFVQGTLANPADPPAITFSGSVDALVIATATTRTATAFTVGPSGYTNFNDQPGGAGWGAHTAIATIGLTAASSEDPGIFTGGATGNKPSSTMALYSAAPPPINGTASTALDDVSTAATASLPVQGTASTNLADVTAIVSAALSVHALCAATLATASVTATANLPVHALGAVTLDAAGADGTGALGVAGAAASTLADATTSALSGVRIQASSAVTLGAASASGTAGTIISGASNVTLQAAVGVEVGSEPIRGAVATTLADVMAEASATGRLQGYANTVLADVAAFATAIIFQFPGDCSTLVLRRQDTVIMFDTCELKTGEFPARYMPESRLYGVDFTGRLDAGEAIVTPDVILLDGDLVISDVLTNGRTVTFRLSGGSPVYQRLAIRAVTDNLPPNTYQAEATIACYP